MLVTPIGNHIFCLTLLFVNKLDVITRSFDHRRDRLDFLLVSGTVLHHSAIPPVISTGFSLTDFLIFILERNAALLSTLACMCL